MEAIKFMLMFADEEEKFQEQLTKLNRIEETIKLLEKEIENGNEDTMPT